MRRTEPHLSCTKCDATVIKSVNGELKIRSKVIVVRNGQTHAICKGCDSELRIPLVVDEGLFKSLANQKEEPRLYLKK